jgi:hypothetical protein
MKTPLFGTPLGGIMQVAHVVDDIEREMQRWARDLGVGPWFLIRHFPIVNATHRGQAIDLDLDVALAFSGSLCLELIQQNNAGPSPYREVVQARGYGFHHCAVTTRDFDAELERRSHAGLEVACSGVTGMGARVAYLDTLNALGGMLEIIETTPQVEKFFERMYAASRAWDGKRPVRVLAPHR